MGFRPSMPDSVPVIGRSPRHRNAFFAFGHGHIGLSLGARTGAVVADLLAAREPRLDLRPSRVDRRSDERRVGSQCVITFTSLCAPLYSINKLYFESSNIP